VKRIHVELLGLLILSSFYLFVPKASANTLQVGPGKQYGTPCAAIAAAQAGDTIQIDTAGNYTGDVCQWSRSNLTLVGVGPGRAVINAAGNSSQRKAIWVISGNNTTVENIEFLGATVPDMNGAGIRAEGNNLTIRNCYFHDNQDGILTSAGNSTILIEYSEFDHNGAGDGFSHNVYIGNIAHLIFRYNYSHRAVVGHLLKSRAAENDIYYNRLSDETTGTASYDIDLPNGGKSFIVGNLIEKGPLAQNSSLVNYEEEGVAAGNPDHELFVINNTMVNDLGHGTFVNVAGSVAVPAVIKNNILQGSGTVTTQAGATEANNFSGNAKLVNPANYDYHLQSGSPAINAGADPGRGAGISLTPVYQYVHPSCAEGRTISGSTIDIGAYEFNGGNGVPPPDAPPRCGSVATSGPSATLSTNSVIFPDQIVSTASPSQSVTLTNSGTAALSISSIRITGADNADFSQSNSCGASLAAGANCSIDLTFKPSTGGTRTGTLIIMDNAAGNSQIVGLSGAGMDFSLSTSPGATTISAGQTTNFTLAITPEGGFNQGVSIACTGAPANSLCSANPASVTLDGSSVSSVSISISTAVRSFVLPGIPVLPLGVALPLTVSLTVLSMIAILATSQRRRTAFAFCGTLLIVLLASSCAGTATAIKSTPPSPGLGAGTPAGSYVITLTGVSGSLTHTATFKLNVN
jgi:hypothetical protein